LTRIFPTQLAIKRSFNFPPHPTSASALPGENRTNENLHFYPRHYYYLIRKHTKAYFVHISVTLTDSSSNCPLFSCLQ